MKKHALLPIRSPQRGAVMLIFGLMLVVLVGFAGLAIDLGRFFVIKSELQNAVDACALSAASQLRPGQNDINALTRAVAYGKVFITGADAVRNKVNFQSTVLDPNVLEITFAATNGPNDASNYQSAIDASPNTAKFVKCNYPLAGLPIYFMRVLNLLGASFSTQTVSAMAVATRDAPTAACIPVAACSAPGGNASNNFGHSVGEWMTAYDGTSYGTGNFGWIDFTPPAGGADEVKAILAGSMQCNIAQIGDPVGQNGNLDTLQEAWNSRFGWYRKGGAYSTSKAPPDKTGFAYSNLTKDGAPNAGNWPSGANAYSGTSSVPNQLNFIQARAVNKPYQVADDIPRGIKTNQYDAPLDATQLNTLGRADRRIVAAPVVNCDVWNTSPGSQKPPILGWACVLMLNPIENGSTASLSAKLEFLGLASDVGSPCSGGAELAISPVLTQ